MGYTSVKESSKVPIFHLVEEALIALVKRIGLDTLLVRKFDKLLIKLMYGRSRARYGRERRSE